MDHNRGIHLMAGSSTESDTVLIDKMNAIRNASERHVEQLHHEVERLKDWREHVKSRPVLAVGAAAVVGFWLVSKLGGSSNSGKHRVSRRGRGPTKSVTEEERAENIATKASMTAGAMGLVGSLASSAIRMAATHYVKSLLDKRNQHD